MKDSLKHLAVGIASAIAIIVFIILLSKLFHLSANSKHQETLLAKQTEDYTMNLAKLNEQVYSELNRHKMNFEDQIKKLEEKLSLLEVRLNESSSRQSVLRHESILSLQNQLDLLNRTHSFDMENNFQRRELAAMHKEQDKHFPFDPMHNSCFKKFRLLQTNATQPQNEATPQLEQEKTVHGNISSRCAFLLGRSSTNTPPVEGSVNLTHSDEKYRLSIAGTILPHTNRFTVNIYIDDESKTNVLHFSPWFNDWKHTVIDTRSLPGSWQGQIYAPLYGLANGKDFKIVITYEDSIFKIVVNDHEPFLFHDRYHDQSSILRRVEIHEAVNIRLLTFEILDDPKSTLIKEDVVDDTKNTEHSSETDKDENINRSSRSSSSSRDRSSSSRSSSSSQEN